MSNERYSEKEASRIRNALKAISGLNSFIYKISKGKLWGKWAGKYPIMLLSVFGSKTGKVRNVPLIKVMHDDKPVLVASMGGMPMHPSWYFNVMANPRISVQIGSEKKYYLAKKLTDEEKDEMWPTICSFYPGYDQYKKNTQRNIGVFSCEEKAMTKEWKEWIDWKEKHLESHVSSKTFFSKYSQFCLAFLICGIVLFFILDRWHLLDPILEFPEERQKHIIDLAEVLLEVPCFPSIMKRKINTVPIKYTRENPVHKNFIKYGEAGIYWGEEHIKIHRSNFWFFGLPKKTQLLNTLVHELRHRSSPGLGHNSEFYKLVKKDGYSHISEAVGSKNYQFLVNETDRSIFG